MGIPESDLRRFFDAKLTKECAGCGQLHAFMFNIGPTVAGMMNEPVELNIPLKDDRPGVAPGAVHGFYALTCGNCGFTNFHHVNQIRQWIKDNPPKEAQS